MTVSPLAAGAVAGVSYSVVGEGSPVTVFAHGLGGDARETRPLANKVGGSRVLLSFRGHGDSDDLPPAGWDYDVLADDLLAVADKVGATRCVGLSLGGGALLRVLHRQPERFDKIAFVMPAVIDAAREDGAVLRLRVLGEAVAKQDVEAATDILLNELPAPIRERRGIAVLVRRRAAQLCSRTPPFPAGDDRPVEHRSQLASLSVPTLVIGQEADPLHQIDVARELAAALPGARLIELGPGGVFWNEAKTAQAALAEHLA